MLKIQKKVGGKIFLKGTIEIESFWPFWSFGRWECSKEMTKSCIYFEYGDQMHGKTSIHIQKYFLINSSVNHPHNYNKQLN